MNIRGSEEESRGSMAPEDIQKVPMHCHMTFYVTVRGPPSSPLDSSLIESLIHIFHANLVTANNI